MTDVIHVPNRRIIPVDFSRITHYDKNFEYTLSQVFKGPMSVEAWFRSESGIYSYYALGVPTFDREEINWDREDPTRQ